jgi:hypothetical protein
MLPPSLITFADRLSGFSTNIVRLEVQGSKTVGPNQQIRVTLPANALLNLKSFALHMSATANITSGTGSARLPADILSMFDRIEVSIGGVQLSAGCNYTNVLNATKSALFESKTANLLHAHGEVVRKASYATSLTTGASESGVKCIARGFHGLLDADAVFDSSLVGDIVVTLHTASTDVVSVSSVASPDWIANMTSQGTAVASYTLADLYASIEVMAISDPAYSAMSQRLIQERGFLEVAYKNYHSSVSTHNGATRFNVSTQSLDRVWFTFRQISGLGANKAAESTLGYNKSTGATSNGVSYDNLPQLNGEKYTPKYAVFKPPDANATYQLILMAPCTPSSRQMPSRGLPSRPIPLLLEPSCVMI